MELTFLDISVFLAFFITVVGISMYKSRKEETGEDFFLAGRGLMWPFIGMSLIAANISTEHFVGMAGQITATVGLAVASYEWTAAITLVVVALFFLPRFLRSGIYTIPEYLEFRYNSTARGIMAFYTMVIYVGVTIAAVLYSGGITLETIFNMELSHAIWLIGGIAALYTTWGGLKAVAWADLFLGSALLIGGAITLVLGLKAVGGIDGFMQANSDKMHVILPIGAPEIPWTALVTGLWIGHFYYWGLNQYIAQRTLASKTLRQGQLGVIFAAGLKLIIPFVIVIPGMIAIQLYGDQISATKADSAYPFLIRNLMPVGIRGFIFAAISGAVISSLASMLNSASAIFTMDLYKRHLKRDASQKAIVVTGRIMTLVFVILGCLIAPQLGNPRFGGIFHYIQEFQGYISPGILAVFVFGMIAKRAPAAAGVVGLLVTVPVYGFLQWQFNQIAFLNRMAMTFVAVIAVMILITIIKPLAEPKVMPVREDFDMKPTPSVAWLGAVVIAATVVMYIIFW